MQDNTYIPGMQYKIGVNIVEGDTHAMCWGCNQWLELEKFGKDSKYADGKRLVCKKCTQLRAKNPKRVVYFKIIAGPSRSFVAPKLRARMDKIARRGREVVAVTVDDRLFRWGPRLKEIPSMSEEWWEYIVWYRGSRD